MNKNKEIELDKLDNWVGIKSPNNKLSREDLSLRRFQFSYRVAYGITLISIVLGVASNFNINELTSNHMVIGGIFYLLLTIVFQRYRSPILLGILLSIILIDKVYADFLMQTTNILNIFIYLLLLLASIQSFRSKKDLIQSKTHIKVIASIFGVILIFPILVYLINPNIFGIDFKVDEEWNNENSKEYTDLIYEDVYQDYMKLFKDRNITMNPKFLSDVATSASKCSLKKTKDLAHNFSDFRDAQNELLTSIISENSKCKVDELKNALLKKKRK